MDVALVNLKVFAQPTQTL